jgi:hypothetical protein
MKKTNLLCHCTSIAFVIAVLLPLTQISPTPVFAQSIGLWNTNCKKLYKQWQAAPNHKAFAVTSATASNYGQACGASWGNSTKKNAESNAIKACKGQRLGTCWVTKSQ